MYYYNYAMQNKYMELYKSAWVTHQNAV